MEVGSSIGGQDQRRQGYLVRTVSDRSISKLADGDFPSVSLRRAMGNDQRAASFNVSDHIITPRGPISQPQGRRPWAAVEALAEMSTLGSSRSLGRNVNLGQ